jgi:hypothetical protein
MAKMLAGLGVNDNAQNGSMLQGGVDFQGCSAAGGSGSQSKSTRLETIVLRGKRQRSRAASNGRGADVSICSGVLKDR